MSNEYNEPHAHTKRYWQRKEFECRQQVNTIYKNNSRLQHWSVYEGYYLQVLDVPLENLES